MKYQANISHVLPRNVVHLPDGSGAIGPSGVLVPRCTFESMGESIDWEDEFERTQIRRDKPGEYLLHELGSDNRDRVIAAIDIGVPVDSLVFAARWWQLETYLRTLVYIQLKVLLGADWQSPLSRQPMNRAHAAGEIRYMASADDEVSIAHTDVSKLFELVDHHWEQCAHGIGLPRAIWRGRVEELTPVRHRLAHCRRPHADDV